MISAESVIGMDNADNENEIKKPVAEDYNSWDEIDNLLLNFFLGGWVTQRLREINTGKKQQDREELAKKRKAEQEGREYKSPLQLELEDVARKREEKKKLKEERRRWKEAKRRG
jgi:hypothetical protein